MRIPENVKVGGLTYDVSVVDRIKDSASPVGRFTAQDGLIEVAQGESYEFMCQTFIHELVHAMNYQMGNSGDEIFDEEHRVDALANTLYMLFEDNPDMFLTSEKTE